MVKIINIIFFLFTVCILRAQITYSENIDDGIIIENHSNEIIYIAFGYYNSRNKSWDFEGWFRIDKDARKSYFGSLKTRTYYVYVVTKSNKKQWPNRKSTDKSMLHYLDVCSTSSFRKIISTNGSSTLECDGGKENVGFYKVTTEGLSSLRLLLATEDNFSQLVESMQIPATLPNKASIFRRDHIYVLKSENK